jgi:DNA-binding MarR family transcriptional regulator
LSPKEKSVLSYISNYPGCKSGAIANKLEIPNPTVKKILRKLIDIKLIEKHGVGPGTNYSIA